MVSAKRHEGPCCRLCMRLRGVPAQQRAKPQNGTLAENGRLAIWFLHPASCCCEAEREA